MKYEPAPNLMNQENQVLYAVLQDVRDQLVALKIAKILADPIDDPFKLALQISGMGIWDADFASGEIAVDSVWLSSLGYTKDDFDHQAQWKDLIHPDDRKRLVCLPEAALSKENADFEIEYRMRSKNGRWIWFLDRGRIVKWSEDGSPLRVVGASRNIARQKLTEDQLEKIAMYDVLTGLPNRRYCEDTLSKAVAAAARNQSKLGVCYLDLDDFDGVNDRYGHAIGNLLLKQVSARLLHCVRNSDFVSRFGGDEFVVLLESNDRLNYEYVIRRILQNLTRPFDLNGVDLAITCSMGVAVFPEGGDNMNELIEMAGRTLCKIKSEGKNEARFA